MRSGRIRLLPEALLSAPVFGLSLVWVFLVQIGEWAAGGGEWTALPVRLALGSLVQVLMFAFPYVTWRVICPRLAPQSWNWILLAALLTGTAVRGIALGVLFNVTGVTDAPELAFRVVASVSHLAVVTVLIWFAVSEVRGLHSMRRQLIVERTHLLDLDEIAQQDLAKLNTRANDEIRRSILESLGGIGGANAQEFRERLRVTIDDVVRPLSHQLAARPSAWTPPQTVVETKGVDWSLAVREGLDPARIHPIAIPVLLVWMGIPIHTFLLGPTLITGLVATLLVAIPGFWLARRAALWITRDRGAGAKAAAFILAQIAGGLSLGLATLPYMQDQPVPFVFVIVTPMFALLIGTAIAIAEAARDQDLALESELRATTEDLRWTLARTRERFRQREGALARTLHGRLQASLAAAFLRLDRAMTNAVDDEVLLETLKREVLQAVADLDVDEVTPDPLDAVISLTESNWSGSVELSFSVEEWAREAIAADPLCARSVNDLIPELVFNGVRHGRAVSMAVKLEAHDHRTLRLSVDDDGVNELMATRYGLGSTLLDEASIAWSRTREDACTTTICLLPVLDPDRTAPTP
jgi:hypothetical protein